MANYLDPHLYKGVLADRYRSYVNEIEDGLVCSPKPIDTILRALHEDYLTRAADQARLAGMIEVYNAAAAADLKTQVEVQNGHNPLDYIIVHDQHGYYWGGKFVFTKDSSSQNE